MRESWPRAPPHYFTAHGTYLITAATLHRRRLFDSGEKLDLLRDTTWGLVYVSHGLAGVALVGLVIAHVYFAVRPEKWWITKSMLLGWITRRQYLEHHDPHRWAVESIADKAEAQRSGR